MAPTNPPAAQNDNALGGEIGYGVGVCDETLSRLSPINRIPGSAGRSVLLRAGVASAGDSGLRPRVAVSAGGLIVFLGRESDGTIYVKRSVDEDHPFEFTRFDWHLARVDLADSVTASPDAEILALQDDRKTRVQLVEARTGRVLFERTAFGREESGVRVQFNPRGETVVVQRDGFIEILDLKDKARFLKGVSFSHAMKREEIEMPSSRTVPLDFESRGEIHVLSSGDRAIQFFKSEPLLQVTLGPRGTYAHAFFGRPPRTIYSPSPIPAHLEGFEHTRFRFLDRPNQTGKGFLSPRETYAAEFRYQYHEADRESFLDVFETARLKHSRSIGVYGSITTMAFSPNERYLAVATTKKAIRIYDLQAAHSRAWLAIDRIPLGDAPDLLGFTRTGDLVVGSAAGAELLRYPLPD